MKLVIISNSGEGLPIAMRLRKEGIDVDIYVHTPNCRSNYDGILTKLSSQQLKSALKKADIVFFDMVRVNQKKKEDAVLLKTFGLKNSVPEVFGPLGDLLKKDHRVIGASALASKLELDRRKGMEIAKRMGFILPEMHEFKTLKDGIKFLKANNEDLWVFKPDDNQDLDLTYVEKFKGELAAKMENEYSVRLKDNIEYVLQKKIDGAEISTEAWIGQAGPVHYNHTIENKRLMDNNLSLPIGSQSNTVWLMNKEEMENCPIIPCLSKMADYLYREGYRGPYDANCIVKNGEPYFLEHTPRAGYDALFCLLTLLKGKLSDFLLNENFDTEFQEGFASSQRISIPPYPYSIPELRKIFAKNVPLFGTLKDYPFFWAEDVFLDNGNLKCAGSDGILGVVTAWGKTIEESWGRCYHNIGKLKICACSQYRMDGLSEALKRYKKLEAA